MEANADVHRAGIYNAVECLFADIFAKSTVLKVDPLRCLSINKLRVRPLCNWAVKMFKRTISGHSGSDTFIQGFISTGKFSIIVPIPDAYRYLVIDHFVEQGKSETEASNLAKDGEWNHVVDGGHMHQTIVEAIDEFSEKFGGFRWPVVRIAWQHPDVLRAIARMCHEMQRENHIVDFTLPDVMHNLREVIDAHRKKTGANIEKGQRNRSATIKDILELYTGAPGFANNTLRTVCGIVLKLSSRFITDMRTLLTDECEEYWNRLGSKKPFGQDCRIYKRLLSTQSLRGARVFFDDKLLTDEDRVNVIHRLRFIAREKASFKSFQCAEIETQARSVIDARQEINKFSAFLGNESWPPALENLRCNMLQTTLLDEEIKSFDGDLLPAIVQTYIKATGVHGTQKLGQFRRRTTIENRASAHRSSRMDREQQASNKALASSAQENATLDGTESVEDKGEGESENEPNRGTGDAVESGDPPTSDCEASKEADSENLLETCGIHIHRKSLLEFERNSTDVGEKFDFMLCDPFQKVPAATGEETPDTTLADTLLDDKGVAMYLQCCRRLLVAGGFCFLFLDWNKLHLWYSVSVTCQLELVCDPFVITKNPEKIQKMKMKGLQCLYDMGMVFRKPGTHPDKFEIDKKTPYAHISECGMPRWCNVISQAPQPYHRLTFKPSKAHVRPSERACEVVMEILQTFCPRSGRVLDPHASVLTTGLACISTERECVLLETDERCLSYALPRLEQYAKTKATNEAANEAAESLLLCSERPSSERVYTKSSANGQVQDVRSGGGRDLNAKANMESHGYPLSREEENGRRDDNEAVGDVSAPGGGSLRPSSTSEGFSRTHSGSDGQQSISMDVGTGSETIGQEDCDSMSEAVSSHVASKPRKVLSTANGSKSSLGVSEHNSAMGTKRRSFTQSLGRTMSEQSQSPSTSRRSKRIRKPIGRIDR